MEARSMARVIFPIVCSIVMSGCAAVAPLTSVLEGGHGAPANDLEIHTQTDVRLQEGNFSTVRTNVVGSSEGFKLLGFITLYPATLNKAMNRMYAQAEVEHGRPQTFAHLIVEHS